MQSQGNSTKPPKTKAIRRKIRVRKEDSAFVYYVLEAHEGIVSYSTLAHQVGDAHRDLELLIPEDFVQEVQEVLKDLGEMVYDLDTGDSSS